MSEEEITTMLQAQLAASSTYFPEDGIIDHNNILGSLGLSHPCDDHQTDDDREIELRVVKTLEDISRLRFDLEVDAKVKKAGHPYHRPEGDSVKLKLNLDFAVETVSNEDRIQARDMIEHILPLYVNAKKVEVGILFNGKTHRFDREPIFKKLVEQLNQYKHLEEVEVNLHMGRWKIENILLAASLFALKPKWALSVVVVGKDAKVVQEKSNLWWKIKNKHAAVAFQEAAVECGF